MAQGQHDTIAYRLSQILIKLNQGDHLSPEGLADEFGVHLRTIQRDLKVRLAYLPLHKERGRYRLDAAWLGKLNYKDIERFATLVGVKGLFPSLDSDHLKDLLVERTYSPWLVHGHHYEDLAGQQLVFKQLEGAVVQRQVLNLKLQRSGCAKTYESVHPYRLVNAKGIWYLAAVHAGKVKTFGIGKIESVELSGQTFEPDPKVEANIENEEGVWHSEHVHRILLTVSAEAAPYFKRRILVPHQKVLHETTDGALTVECSVGHPNQILPIVRYWIPNVRIDEPKGWQRTLELSLCQYLGMRRNPELERCESCCHQAR